MADLLAYASAWAYADPVTFAFMMAHRGMKRWRIYYMRLGNDPLFVVSSAYLLQSYTGGVGILVFRGTEPTSMINWMTDLTIKPERFQEGEVHGGILRNLKAIWPLVSIGLYSLEVKANLTLLRVPRAPGEQLSQAPILPPDPNVFFEVAYGLRGENADEKGTPRFDDPKTELYPLKALYITGHSLGGAMAALAAAKVGRDAQWQDVRRRLRGCYTYGAPMLATPLLADALETSFGDKVFRHVYARDVVPQLPPHLTGKFKHFGREYRSKRDGDGWELASPFTGQTRHLLTLWMAGLGLVFDQFPLLRGFIERIPLSIDDHSPRHYMRISERARTDMF
jgi:hypothetical protein